MLIAVPGVTPALVRSLFITEVAEAVRVLKWACANMEWELYEQFLANAAAVWRMLGRDRRATVL
jgi:hypothetical protein